jgi:hypothetical protein
MQERMANLVHLRRLQDRGDAYVRYRIDEHSGSFEVQSAANAEDASKGCAGFADEVQIGVASRSTIFVAVYAATSGKGITVRLGSRLFQTHGTELRAIRNRILPLVKRFVLWQGGTVAFEASYLRRDDYDAWPGPEATDIFFLIARVLRTPADTARFSFMWTARSRGERIDTPEFQAAMRDHLERGTL